MSTNPFSLPNNKENHPPIKQSKSNKFSDWSQTKNAFLINPTSADLLNWDAMTNSPAPSMGSIQGQQTHSSLQLKTSNSIPVDFDLLDLGFVVKTPQTGKSAAPAFNSKTWMDFSDFTEKIVEKKLTLILENGLEGHLSFKVPTSKPTLVASLVNMGIDLEKGFYLLDSYGKAKFIDDIPNLSEDSTYYVKSSVDDLNVMTSMQEKADKIKVEADPFAHTEFLVALKTLKEGLTLLKITREGEAKFKFFQLSQDQRALCWYSSHKLRSQTAVPLDGIKEIKPGFRFKELEKLGMTNFATVAFTIIYNRADSKDDFELNVICKDRSEFDMVITVLKGLVVSIKSGKISKQTLLAHVRRFLVSSQDAKPLDCKQIFDLEEKDPLKVEDFMVKKVYHEKDLFQALDVMKLKFFKLIESNKAILDSVFTIKPKVPGTPHDIDEENIRFYYPKFCRRYVTLIHELSDFCEQDLPDLKAFLEPIGLNSSEFLDAELSSKRPGDKRNSTELYYYFDVINKQIWKLNLELENLRDFIERIKDKVLKKNKVEKIADKVEGKIKDTFSGIGDAFSSFGRSLSMKFEAKIEAWKDDLM